LTKSVTLDMVVYKYQIWDTAGQEKVSGVHCQQLTTCSLCDEDCTHCKHLEVGT